eukprot:597534-Pyramimonas_sp.AAC.1
MIPSGSRGTSARGRCGTVACPLGVPTLIPPENTEGGRAAVFLAVTWRLNPPPPSPSPPPCPPSPPPPPPPHSLSPAAYPR